MSSMMRTSMSRKISLNEIVVRFITAETNRYMKCSAVR